MKNNQHNQPFDMFKQVIQMTPNGPWALLSYSNRMIRLVFVTFSLLVLFNSANCKFTLDPSDLPVFNLTIPKDDPTYACIKMTSAFLFTANYTIRNKFKFKSPYNVVNFTLHQSDNFTYTGYCEPNRNMIELSFLNDWRLEMYFYKDSSRFLFKHVVLYYKLNPPLFPNAVHDGAQSEVYDFIYINSSLSKSYVCMSGIQIDLGEIKIQLKNLTVEPFFNKRPNQEFDSAEVCANDLPPTPNIFSENFWIFMFAGVVIILIIFSCAIYIIITYCESRDYKTAALVNQSQKKNLLTYKSISQNNED